MRLVCISDTHGQHEQLKLPDGDVLIHAGDSLAYFDFYSWFHDLDYKYKIFIAGNHDALLVEERGMTRRKWAYLLDASIEVDGVKFYGSPWSPKWDCELSGRNFMKERGEEIAEYWQLIPKETDVLITHCPPYGKCDKSKTNKVLGCEELAKVIPTLPNLKAHIFGHVHEGYGQDGIHYNVSVCDADRNLVNPPTVIDI